MLSIFMGLPNADENMFRGLEFCNFASEKFWKYFVKGVRTDPGYFKMDAHSHCGTHVI